MARQRPMAWRRPFPTARRPPLPTAAASSTNGSAAASFSHGAAGGNDPPHGPRRGGDPLPRRSSDPPHGAAFSSPHGVAKNGMSPYFGCIVGRVANRIKNGKFTLNGFEYSLPVNNGPNSLHGGLKGFDKVVWDVVEHKDGQCPSITFQYHSSDGEEGYPGDVTIRATYSLPEATTLRLDMEATAENKATPISLAQHTYWNLAGHASGDILNHSIQIWGKHITPVDENTIPTGEIMPVHSTPFDFTTEHKIGERINDVPGGYDHNYVLDCGDEKNGLKHAAKLRDPSSLRTLDLWTDAPGMQFYTANYVNDISGKGSAVYNKHAGVCLETQGFPNAINQPNFPPVVVEPGEKYKHTMLFEFSA